jgi:tetratricopeptide (TPR) repeat protein/tRNA A-37 threonylcarbamoyl transferase component Bud32
MSTPPQAPTPCPDPETLERLLRDELAPPVANEVESHVAACPHCQNVLERLVESLPGTLPALLPPGAVRADEPPDLPGYAILGRIDEGGMGVVWRARELAFGRTLAIKVVKAGDPQAVRRSLAEARIAGGLAHPSIVPVHARGRLPDGRPYFTMKLVEGETLAALLRGRPSGGRPAEFVRVFAQVCQAVAYAHDCGVIHRDLKPANVMVGAFGEVQVMDWGLAKSLADAGDAGEPAADAPVGLAAFEATHRTRAGVVLGTLPYMPPEQARGEVDALDRRCDVFNLGAILCEILTGDPPFRCESHDDVLRRAAAGDLADTFARLDACGADPELVALAKSCLHPDRDGRPPDAGAVAARVIAYEAGAERRLRRAEVERAEAQSRARGEHHRRRLATGLAATVLVGLIGTAAGSALLWEKNRALVAANDELDRARGDAVRTGEQAVRARDRALRALDQMTSGLIGESLEAQPAITAEQKQFLTQVLGDYQEFAREQGEDAAARERVAAAAFRVGLIHYRFGLREAGRAAFEQARANRARLAEEFPDEPRHRAGLAECDNNLGVMLRELGSPDEAEAAFRRAVAGHEKLVERAPTDARRRSALAGTLSNLGLVLGELPNRSREAEDAHRKALAIREKLAAEFPDVLRYRRDLAASHNHLGGWFEQSRRWPEAEESYRAALAVGERLAAEHLTGIEGRGSRADSLYNLAGLLRRRDRRSDAEESYRTVLSIRQKLAAEFPAVPRLRQDVAAAAHNLGLLLAETRMRPGEPEKLLREGLAIRERLASEFPRLPEYRQELADSYYGLGTLLRESDRRPEAEQEFRRAAAVLEALIAEFPVRPRHRRALAGTHSKLGRLFAELRRWPEAETEYRKAVAIREKLDAEFPRTAEHRAELAAGCFHLAELLGERDPRSDEARALYIRSQAICGELAVEFPHVLEHRQDLAAGYNNLAVMLRRRGDSAGARAAYRECLVHLEKLAADFPDAPGRKARLAAAQVNLGNLLSRDGDPAEALAWYDKAVAGLGEEVKARPDAAPERQILRTAHWGRAEALDNIGRPAEAVADWDRAVELSPPRERPAVRAARARTLVRAGQVARALAEAEDLAKSPAAPADQLYTLACVHALAARADEANRDAHVESGVRLLRRAVDRGFRDVKQLKADEDLRPLRDHEGFRRLLLELGKDALCMGREGTRSDVFDVSVLLARLSPPTTSYPPGPTTPRSEGAPPG